MTFMSYSFLDLKDLCYCLLESIGKQEHRTFEQTTENNNLEITVDEKVLGK